MHTATWQCLSVNAAQLVVKSRHRTDQLAQQPKIVWLMSICCRTDLAPQITAVSHVLMVHPSSLFAVARAVSHCGGGVRVDLQRWEDCILPGALPAARGCCILSMAAQTVHISLLTC
jgi:hypothetical protein